MKNATLTIVALMAMAAAASARRARLASVPGTAIDLAHGSQRRRWIHHPVFGDPSWDSFRRIPGNPVRRGSAPYEWPVNGSLFEDPASGDWFLFIGLYRKNYGLGVDGQPSICILERSRDRGKTWVHLARSSPRRAFTSTG